MRSPLNHSLIVTQRFMARPKVYKYTNGHPGLDLRSPLNDDWFACVPGVLNLPKLNANGYKGYGYAACIDWGQADGNFIRFLYGHGTNRRQSLNGKQVPVGAYIAESGNTGFSTAPHLHLELRQFYRKKDRGKFYDATVKLRYDLLDPENFFKRYNFKYTYK